MKINSKRQTWKPVAESIRRQIVQLPSGAQLPSIRQLMKEYSVSQSTVQLALEELAKEDLIVSRVGRGTFLADSSEANRVQTVMIMRGDYPSRRGDDITRAVQREIDRKHYRALVVTYTDMEHALETLSPLRRSDGYILQPLIPQIPVRLLQFLRERSRAVVVDGVELGCVDVDCINSDLQNSVDLAMRHLVNLGHRRIAMASGEPLIGHGRLRAIWYFEQIMRWMGLDGTVLNCKTIPQESSTANMRHHMETYLAAHTPLPFSAMIVDSFGSAVGVWEAMEAAGKQIPRDLSVVVLDNPDIDSSYRDRMTLVGRTSTAIAKGLLDRLDWRFENPQAPYEAILAPTEIVDRGSAAKRT